MTTPPTPGMRTVLGLTVLGALAVTGAGCAAAADSVDTAAREDACVSSIAPGRTDSNVEIDGHTRAVTVIAPESGEADSIVFALHGSNNSIDSILAMSELAETAETEGYILVVPQGSIPGNGDGLWAWNVPGVVTTDEVGSPKDSADDVSFLTQLAAQMAADGCIDDSRVFATGFSGGARMISSVACTDPGVFAAIAPVDGLRAGTPVVHDGEWVPDAASCAPADPTAVIAFAGDTDPINPYAGGGADYWQYGQQAALDRWGELNGCVATGSPQVDGDVTVTEWDGCDAPVVEYRIAGMGHTWPGRAQKLQAQYAEVLGAVSDAVDANSVMWEFFESLEGADASS